MFAEFGLKGAAFQVRFMSGYELRWQGTPGSAFGPDAPDFSGPFKPFGLVKYVTTGTCLLKKEGLDNEVTATAQQQHSRLILSHQQAAGLR